MTTKMDQSKTRKWTSQRPEALGFCLINATAANKKEGKAKVGEHREVPRLIGRICRQSVI